MFLRWRVVKARRASFPLKDILETSSPKRKEEKERRRLEKVATTRETCMFRNEVYF